MLYKSSFLLFIINNNFIIIIIFFQILKNISQDADSGIKQLPPVDHDKMNYVPFSKDFYIEVPEIANMTEEEVAEYRKEDLEGVVIRGSKKKGVRPCPRPIKKFTQVWLFLLLCSCFSV